MDGMHCTGDLFFVFVFVFVFIFVFFFLAIKKFFHSITKDFYLDSMAAFFSFLLKLTKEFEFEAQHSYFEFENKKKV